MLKICQAFHETHSFLRCPLKKLAHSKQVFLLPTQNTEGMPTTSIIRYLIRNKAMSGLLVCSTCEDSFSHICLVCNIRTEEIWFVIRTFFPCGSRCLLITSCSVCASVFLDVGLALGCACAIVWMGSALSQLTAQLPKA